MSNGSGGAETHRVAVFGLLLGVFGLVITGVGVLLSGLGTALFAVGGVFLGALLGATAVGLGRTARRLAPAASGDSRLATAGVVVGFVNLGVAAVTLVVVVLALIAYLTG